MDLQDLRERVAGATGADRIVDFWLAVRFSGVGGLTPERVLAVSHEHDEYHISWLQGKIRKQFTRYHGGGIKRYTASVGAALALIERVLPGAAYVFSSALGCRASILLPDGGEFEATARSPALALISTLLAAAEAGQPVSPVGGRQDAHSAALPTGTNSNPKDR